MARALVRVEKPSVVTAQTEVEGDVTAGSYGLVAAGAVSYACLTFVWFSLPAYLAPLIEEVGLTGAQAGVLAGAVPLTYVPLALLTGLAVDRVGPVWSIAAGLVTFGLAQVGRSVAAGFPTLLATTLLIGVGATAITFGLPKLASVSFPPDRTGAPSSIYLVGASAGTARAVASTSRGSASTRSAGTSGRSSRTGSCGWSWSSGRCTSS
jgi:sugar phosphate permease